MKGLDGRASACIFECLPGRPDSIEHYAVCPAVAAFGMNRLGLRPVAEHRHRLLQFLALDIPNAAADREGALKRAIRTAAVYRTHCLVRHGLVQRGAAAIEALPQSARELARGHPGASRMVG